MTQVVHKDIEVTEKASTTTTQVLSNSIVQAIILLEGFVTISLEILTIRQLIPVVGNSVIVTSLIIGIFLLFLAYGYRKGGFHDDNYHKILKNNFTLAAMGLGIGLSYVFIGKFFYVAGLLLKTSVLIPLILYLLLITAPLVYLLGQTVPITLNLCKPELRVGTIGGKVLHISTLGSFLGAILTTLLLMNWLGVAWTVFINFLVLAMLVIFLMDIRKEWFRFLLLIVFAVIIFMLNVVKEKNLFVLTNNYANYQVMNNVYLPPDRLGKIFLINDAASSFITPTNQAFPYIELMRKVLFTDLNLHNKNILLLGAGGFSLSAGQDPSNHFTYVDIDKQIRQVTEQHFLPKINGNFVADDARHFLINNSQRYDAVVVDTYNSKIVIPAHLLTYEYFLAIKKILNDDGVMLVNVFGRPTLDDNYSKRVDNTIRAVFANCMAIPLRYSEKLTNIIYVCKKTRNEKDKNIYTDDLNRSTWDYFNIQ